MGKIPTTAPRPEKGPIPLRSIAQAFGIPVFHFFTCKHASWENLISRHFQNCLRPLFILSGIWPTWNKSKAIQRRMGGANTLAWGVWLGGKSWKDDSVWSAEESIPRLILQKSLSKQRQGEFCLVSWTWNDFCPNGPWVWLGENYLTCNAIALSKG